MGYGDNELRARLKQQQAGFLDEQYRKKDWSDQGSQAAEIREKLGIQSPAKTPPTTPKIDIANSVVLVAGTDLPPAGTSYSDMARKINSSTKFDELVISVTLDVSSTGNYVFSVDLYGTDDTYITHLFAKFDLTAGSQTIDLHFDGRILGTLGIDGPYELDLRVYNDRADIIEGGIAVHTTQAYKASDFEQMLDVIVKNEALAHKFLTL